MRKIVGVILLIISLAMIIKGSIMSLAEKSYLVQFVNIEVPFEYEIVNGGYIRVPNEPTKEGYKFIGWYYNGSLFDFSTPVFEDLEIEARWQKIEFA